MKKMFSRQLYFVILSALFLACEEDNALHTCPPFDESLLNQEQQAFMDIAFNQEYGDSAEGLRKWAEDIFIFIQGKPSPLAVSELKKATEEINQLSESINLHFVSQRDSANMVIFFGEKADYITLLEPEAAGFAEESRGFVSIAWNDRLEIVNASVCVDVVNHPDAEAQNHIIREEVAQALGLINDTKLIENSIFYQGSPGLQTYSTLDKKMIRTILNPKVTAGMCRSEVLPFLN